jgi:DNA-binding CsgD family transcriptional regulator
MKNLAPQELNVLKELAKGKTYKEAAAQNNLSVRTIYIYLSRSKAKLNTRTTVQTVAVAVGAGLITLDGISRPDPAKSPA